MSGFSNKGIDFFFPSLPEPYKYNEKTGSQLQDSAEENLQSLATKRSYKKTLCNLIEDKFPRLGRLTWRNLCGGAERIVKGGKEATEIME